MNSPRLTRIRVSFIAFTFAALGLRAQFAVAVAIDLPATFEWMAEEAYWASALNALTLANSTLRANNRQLSKANSALRDLSLRVGSPTEGARLAFGGYTAADTPSKRFITEALSRADLVSKPAERDSILASLKRVDDLTAKAIGTEFSLGTTTYAREVKRYRVSTHEEKLRDEVNRAVETFHKIQLKEHDFQKKQSDGMSKGTLTVSEIEARGTAIESSQGRVELARNRLDLARAELETFIGEIKLEQRKMQTAFLEEQRTHKANEHERADRMREKVGLWK